MIYIYIGRVRGVRLRAKLVGVAIFSVGRTSRFTIRITRLGNPEDC